MKSHSSIARFCIACTALSACAAEPGTDIESGERYVADRAYRRAALEDSVVNPDNGYSALRLEQYATKGGGWDELPVLQATVSPLRKDDLGTFDAVGSRATDVEGEPLPAVEWNHASLMEAGRWAFNNYPMATDTRLAGAVASELDAQAVGLWIDADDRVGGLVVMQRGDGTEAVAWTCATCHSSLVDGELVAGRTNAELDSGVMMRLAGVGNEAVDAWGPGRVDSSRDGTNNPVLVTDLRAIRFQNYLHHTATLRNSLEALAVRVETLLVVSHSQTERPPRELAFALAYYMWNLGEEPTPVETGRDLFEANCAECHHIDGSTAEPVEPSRVGTRDDIEDAPGRGTGLYRVPSLVGVSNRPLLLHDGSIGGLEELLDPARVARVPGHTFGHQLSDDERRLLLTFVRSL